MKLGFEEVERRSLRRPGTRARTILPKVCSATASDIIATLGPSRDAHRGKVSNSSTNSVKRLNNDAAVKATSRKTDFGLRQVVPSAVLSGVYKLHNLLDAQERGLTIFWAHDWSH